MVLCGVVSNGFTSVLCTFCTRVAEDVAAAATAPDDSAEANAMFASESAKGFGDGEDLLGDELALQDTYLWQDKYRPRKPRSVVCTVAPSSLYSLSLSLSLSLPLSLSPSLSLFSSLSLSLSLSLPPPSLPLSLGLSLGLFSLTTAACASCFPLDFTTCFFCAESPGTSIE